MSSHFVAVGSVWGSHTYYGVSVQRVKNSHQYIRNVEPNIMLYAYFLSAFSLS